jgi:DNA-directed RNA polymerase specialized sigma24 family protein
MSETVAKVKWQLTQEAFDRLLAALDAGDREAAGEKYLRIRRNLVRFFEGRGFFDAATHADEAFNRTAKKLTESEIGDVGQYVYGVARFLVLEIYKQREKEGRIAKTLPEAEFPQAAADEAAENAQKLACLNGCLGGLPADNQKIILEYYRGEKRDKIENRRRLAQNLGIPQNALRNRAVRLREKLEECILNCLEKK